jgi:hypothetical protein
MGGGAQRPGLCVNELKKTGARSAQARTRGQNTLVYEILICSGKSTDWNKNKGFPCLQKCYCTEKGITFFSTYSKLNIDYLSQKMTDLMGTGSRERIQIL